MACDDGNTYVLLLSEIFSDDSGKHCYGMLEGGNVIYILSPEKARWVTVLPIDIASRIMVASYVWNITDLDVKCSDGSSESFKITLKDADLDEIPQRPRTSMSHATERHLMPNATGSSIRSSLAQMRRNSHLTRRYLITRQWLP